MRFVAGIDHAPPSKRRLLTSLIGAARDLLMKTVAEGIETPGEAEVCSSSASPTPRASTSGARSPSRNW